MRRICLLTAALVVPVVPVLAAAPAYAVDNVICVGSPAGPCDTTVDTIPLAIALANGNGVADTIFVGPGTYSDGPYQLTAGKGLTLKGSGSATVITLPPASASQIYVTVDGATVRDLTVDLEPTTSDNDEGIRAFNGAVVDNVTVDGAGTANATGIHTFVAQVTGTTVLMPSGSGSRGIYGEGGGTYTDSTISGSTAFNHSGENSTDTLSRTTLHAGTFAGVVTDSGNVDIDNSVVDLGSTGGTGLLAANFNSSTSLKAINADHVTIVGGSGSSEGAWAYAATPGAKQTSTVSLTNSIVHGPAKSLLASADNNGAQGGNSTATINVSHTDYDPATTLVTLGAFGAGGISAGAGNLDVDPAFADAATGDYHLSQGSPVVDQGDPAAGLPGDQDRDGAARVVDGDVNGSAIRDQGAYEFVPDLVAPQTTVTGGPTGPTRETTPTFTFTSEPGATFSCQVDAGAYGACSSPFTTAALANGDHTFRVRATDAANNTDATPAARSFKVDTIAPATTITRKPAKRITTKRARFAFSSEAGARFQCRLDQGAWTSCTSPRTVKVRKGRHRFAVRALDAAGNIGTPATYRFRRV